MEENENGCKVVKVREKTYEKVMRFQKKTWRKHEKKQEIFFKQTNWIKYFFNVFNIFYICFFFLSFLFEQF